MTDYGHPLRFGAFITPTNGQPQVPVRLAQLTERLGYDLVTFQGHPYQPRFLDTWTLLSYVAAATTRIHLSPNVLSLPMRDPLVAARAAASLDLLSGGRFELGLGAGVFWDAIAAMGRRRLGPGDAVEALNEAIDLMRGLWRAEDRAPLLADLAVEHGFSTFIVATDDVDVLTRFADETAPQVRRDVDAGRPDQGTEIHTGQRTDQGEQQS